MISRVANRIVASSQVSAVNPTPRLGSGRSDAVV
jgi:hypothetical protein